MSEHSPEPWRVADHYGDFHAYDSNDNAVLTTDREVLNPLRDADILRIVACVNACRGVPTEALTDPGLDGKYAKEIRDA
mgnify:CR=1 FL=1